MSPRPKPARPHALAAALLLASALGEAGCAPGGTGAVRPASPSSAVVASVTVPLVLPLWPAGAPGSPAPGDTGRAVERPLDARGPIARITDVTRPTITLFRPAATRGAVPVVLVFPGGGYQWLAVDIEGTEVCRWLTGAGLACGLVKYRVPQPADTNRYVQPLQDAQRALGLVRAHAAEWGIDTRRVGVVGFSAGAHVAALLGNHFAHRRYAAVDAADSRSCRPDFALVIYPGYLAVDRDSARVRPEVQPTPRTPPTFLVQAADDPVGVWNVVAYHRALVAAGVPAELHVYPRGGHGYGVRASVNEAAAAWPAAALRWLAQVGMLTPPEASASDPATR